jgi:hypothetical protein
MAKTIDKGMSMLNATDETVNPYGLILSKIEREAIYGDLTRIDNRTNALLYGKTGWKQQARASFSALLELGVVSVVTIGVHNFFGGPVLSTFVFVFAFVVLQKLNLLLTHEKLEETDARREREDKKEAKRRAEYFQYMGVKDLSLEE